MKKGLLKFLFFLLYMGLVIAASCVGVWAIFATLRFIQYKSSFALLVFLGWVVLYWVTIVVHEFGHLLAAWAMKLHVQRVVILPLEVSRVSGGFRVRFFIHNHLWGLVEVRPVDIDRLRQRMAVLFLGGPVANLLVGILCLVVAALVDPFFPSLWPRSLTTYWLYLAGLANLFQFFVNLIPFKPNHFSSDGLLLLGNSRSSAKHEREFLHFTLGTAMVGGTRPSAWPAADVQRMLALRDGSASDVEINLYGYYYAGDCQDWDQAGIYLDLAFAQYSQAHPRIRDAILLEKAYFEAFHRQIAAARTWLTQVKGNEVERHTRWRAEAAVLFVERNYSDAAAKTKDALAAVPQSRDRGGSLTETDWLQVLLAECEKRLNSISDQCPLTTIVGELRQDVP
jgi:hypothetical protein